jgi:rubrerythrin
VIENFINAKTESAKNITRMFCNHCLIDQVLDHRENKVKTRSKSGHVIKSNHLHMFVLRDEDILVWLCPECGQPGAMKKPLR